jgi:hypothetical protein
VAHFSIDMQPLTGLFSVAALFTVGSHVISFGLIFIIAYSQMTGEGATPAGDCAEPETCNPSCRICNSAA